MKNMKLSVKLIGAFLLVSFIAFAVGLLGTMRLSAISKADSEMYENNTRMLGVISEVAAGFQEARSTLRAVYITKFMLNKDIGSFEDKLQEINRKGITGLQEFGKSIKDAEVKKEYDKAMATLAQYSPERARCLTLMKEGKSNEALASLETMAPTALKVGTSFDKLVKMNIEMAGKKAESNAEAAHQGIFFIWMITGFGTLLGIGLGIFLTLSITRPINKVVAGLSDGADQVASASGQVSSASQSLAEGTSEQAASLEETSSSLEEMSSMTQRNADNAREAKAMMDEARQIVEKVHNNMEGMKKAMDAISSSTRDTDKIIKTIDEIAFQTNLLALNAAVEAARAGEAGAGFAVVAEEVRNLALRSAEAAKNTNNLIENTIRDVKNGSDLTRMTDEAFNENIEISKKVQNLVEEIVTASNEQAHGIGQVNLAVMEMDKVTQQTAANAEESASASEELNAQAQQMKVYVQELIAVIGGSGHGRIADSSTGAASMTNARENNPFGSGSILLPSHAGRSNPGRLAGNARKVRPEQMISFDDGNFR